MQQHAVFEVSRRNPLAGLECLASRVAIYIPSTQGKKPALPLAIQYQRDKVAEAFSRWFGGYTEVQARGGWYSEQDGILIEDKIRVVYANTTPELLAKQLPWVVALATGVGRAMEQECVTLEINGGIYFVPPGKSHPAGEEVADANYAN